MTERSRLDLIVYEDLVVEPKLDHSPQGVENHLDLHAGGGGRLAALELKHLDKAVPVGLNGITEPEQIIGSFFPRQCPPRGERLSRG
jgi:hypothetical protein